MFNLDELVHIALSRSALLEAVPSALETAQAVACYERTGQATLFEASGDRDQESGVRSQESEATLVEFEERRLTEKQKKAIVLAMLRNEREMLGCYMTADPLQMYDTVLAKIKSEPIVNLLLAEIGEEKVVAGFCTGITRLTTKRGKPFVRFKLEDASGEINVVGWSEFCDKFGLHLRENEAAACRGHKDLWGDAAQMIIEKLKPLEAFK